MEVPTANTQAHVAPEPPKQTPKKPAPAASRVPQQIPDRLAGDGDDHERDDDRRPGLADRAGHLPARSAGLEACDLRWDDIDLPKRTMIIRRLKGSTDSVHYLEWDEVNGLKLLQRQQQADGIKGAYVFINERGQPFARMGIGRTIERAGGAAGLPFPVHVHMLRHSTGYALTARGMTHDGSSTSSDIPRLRIPCDTQRCRRSRSRIFGAD
jgi:site-specific recombinase XerC